LFFTLIPVLALLSNYDQENCLINVGTEGIVAVPEGATQLYLGMQDGFQWVGNSGAFTVTISVSDLRALNPFAPYAILQQGPPTLSVPAVPYSPPATSLAADGKSAVVLVYKSKSAQPVTFDLSAAAPGGSPVPFGVGSLGQFQPDYLAGPSPPGDDVQRCEVTESSGPDAGGNYVFLALLWGPNAMPVANVPLVNLTVTAAQEGQTDTSQAFVALEPPPLLLIHGIWSNAAAAGFSSISPVGFYHWISSQYPHNLIYAVDYGSLSSQAFGDPGIQSRLLSRMTNALASAAAAGMAARSVDVVAHSMGGLVARYFLSAAGYLGNPALLPNPVHKLITIGTPHLGSNLATTLFNNQDQPVEVLGPVVQALCLTLSPCTLGGVFGALGKPIGAGVQSLEPGSPQHFSLSSANVFSSIVGTAPPTVGSVTEVLLDALIGAYLPGQSVASILSNQLNDTIVPITSQDPPGAWDTATISGIVHTNLCDALPPLSVALLGPCPDTGETQSTAVWAQAYWWLTGGTAYAPTLSLTSSATKRALTSADTVPLPVLDLSGYTQVAASNVAFMPTTGSVLTINSPTNITAASSTRAITEVLLLQTVTDPTDTPLLYSTQSSVHDLLYADAPGIGKLQRYRGLQRQNLCHDGVELYLSTQRRSVRAKSGKHAGCEHDRGHFTGGLFT